MQCRSQYSAQLLTNKDHLDVSESEKKRRILNIKTTFRGKYSISLTEDFDLCGDGKNLSKKEMLIKIRNFLGVKINACDEIPKIGWNMENLETGGISLLRAKHKYRVMSDKIAFLVCPENPTFCLQAVNMQETKVFNTVK